MEQKHQNWLMRIMRFLKKNISNFIAILALIGTIIGLIVSTKGLNNANDQFEKNSKNSDSLFNIQVEYENERNERLISQINELQLVTNMQMELIDSLIKQNNRLQKTSNSQLRIQTESLRQAILMGRPMFQFGKSFVGYSSLNGLINKWSVETQITNMGQRFAIDTKFRSFLIPIDGLFPFTIVSHIKFQKSFKNLAKDLPVAYTAEHSLMTGSLNKDFYYVIELMYYDAMLDSTFSQKEYYYYCKKPNESQLDFWSCEPKTVLRLDRSIKSHLNSLINFNDEKWIIDTSHQ